MRPPPSGSNAAGPLEPPLSSPSRALVSSPSLTAPPLVPPPQAAASATAAADAAAAAFHLDDDICLLDTIVERATACTALLLRELLLDEAEVAVNPYAL